MPSHKYELTLGLLKPEWHQNIMEILVEDRCRRIEEWGSNTRYHLANTFALYRVRLLQQLNQIIDLGWLETRSSVAISRLITSGFKVETAARSYWQSVLTVRPPTPCK